MDESGVVKAVVINQGHMSDLMIVQVTLDMTQSNEHQRVLDQKGMVRPTIALAHDTLSIGEIMDTPNNSQLYTPNPYL